ncbi:MAG: sigma-70 family RNA polymerase sigma factor [Armatimonadota bacterium]|nr:sigma-70 family RNA polymerase sigma factor [Armatimonadota bacterium]
MTASLPSIDELAALYARTRAPDVRAHLVDACVPLVEALTARFRRIPSEAEDLRQVGYLGLLQALETYDPTRGVHFATYARPIIRGHLSHYLRDMTGTIRKPRWLRAIERDLAAHVERFVATHRRYPSLEELAAALNVTEAGLLEILRARAAVRTTSLDAEEEDEDEPDIDRRLIRHRAYASFQLPIEDRIALYDAIDRLSALQRRVIYYLFFHDLTQTVAAARLGISQKHVSRALAAALRRLRQHLAPP